MKAGMTQSVVFKPTDASRRRDRSDSAGDGTARSRYSENDRGGSAVTVHRSGNSVDRQLLSVGFLSIQFSDSVPQIQFIQKSSSETQPDGSCRSSSFGGVLWITRRQSQLGSEPCRAKQSEGIDGGLSGGTTDTSSLNAEGTL